MKSSGGSLRTLRALGAPLAKTCLLRSGGFALLRGLAPSRRIGILRYHAICDEEGFAYASPSICISPGAFEAQVGYLAANYSVLPLPEIVDRLRHDRPLPRNTVAITFDDGYADNLPAALDALARGMTFAEAAGFLSRDEGEVRKKAKQLKIPYGGLRGYTHYRSPRGR